MNEPAAPSPIPPPCLCIRADADERIGIGHVMRCLALAQEWRRRGGHVCLISALNSPALRKRVIVEGVDIEPVAGNPGGTEDLASTIATAQNRRAVWLVLDGYHFDRKYMLGVQNSGLHLLILDDLADRDLGGVEAILNQNAYATELMYGRFHPRPNLLLGTAHALIRQEFIEQREERTVAALGQRVLVTLGGADVSNVTLLVMSALRLVAGTRLDVKLVIGTMNMHLTSLEAAVPELREKHDVELIVNPPNLPTLMKWSDLTITAAGSSCWELCCLGVPLVVIETAENQRMMSPYLTKHGIADVFGKLDETRLEELANRVGNLVGDVDARARLSRAALSLIDGQGVSRVATFMLDRA